MIRTSNVQLPTSNVQCRERRSCAKGKGVCFWSIAVIILAVALSGCVDSKKEQYIIGFRGRALANPFLAAERMLTQLDCKVEQMDSLDMRKKGHGVLITNPAAFVNYGDTQETMKWVQRGGHMVLFMSEYEKWRNDFSPSSFKDLLRQLTQEELPDEAKLLFDELGMEMRSRGVRSGDELEETGTEVRINDRRLKCAIPGQLQFKQEPRSDVRSEGKNPALVSFERGAGRVTIVASAQPFRNRWIDDLDHASLLWSIVGLADGRLIWFCDGARISFFAMLWNDGWMAIVAVTLLIALWLWKNLPRFGPLRTLQEESARDFTAHLQLTGAFLWRQQVVRELLAPTQRAVTAAIQRVGWHPSQRDYFQKIADRVGLTAERVQDALTLNETEEPQYFQRLIRDLQTIREKF